jgi:hypothetical protein
LLLILLFEIVNAVNQLFNAAVVVGVITPAVGYTHTVTLAVEGAGYTFTAVSDG